MKSENFINTMINQKKEVSHERNYIGGRFRHTALSADAGDVQAVAANL